MSTQVGIIAEDQSDVDVLKIIIGKLAKRPIVVQRFVGHGCGKIVNKCRGWAENLHQRGCKCVIVVQDLDGKNLGALRSALEMALDTCGTHPRTVVIAVQELEAWLLADSAAISAAFGFKRPIGKVANPEALMRPKEHLRDLVFTRSGKTIRYLNTVHNKVIAMKIATKNLRRCPSFVPLEAFAKLHF